MTHQSECIKLRQRLNFCLRLQLLLLSAWRLLPPGTVYSFPCMLAVAPARFQLQEGEVGLPCPSPAARPAPGSAVNIYWMNFKKSISSMPLQSQPSNLPPPQMSPTFSFIIWVLLLSFPIKMPFFYDTFPNCFPGITILPPCSHCFTLIERSSVSS